MTGRPFDEAGAELLGLAEPSAVIMFEVNGETVTQQVPARLNVADLLRHTLGLTGTHVGCEQGVCGMCTVIVNGQAVKSCLMFAPQLDGCQVQTVESLAGEDSLSPLQQLFADEHALQCGFCTPAFLMTATALATAGRQMTSADIRAELAGVLCRCTGYEFIITAVERYLASKGVLASD
jgi:aerobic-type carbon monoxide dehydrogenase small subunit (CoxS/CutS family)